MYTIFTTNRCFYIINKLHSWIRCNYILMSERKFKKIKKVKSFYLFIYFFNIKGLRLIMKILTFIVNPKFIIAGCTESQSPKHISFFCKKHTPFYLQSHHELILDRSSISFTMPFIAFTPMFKVFVSRPGELSQIVVIFLTS